MWRVGGGEREREKLTFCGLLALCVFVVFVFVFFK